MIGVADWVFIWTLPAIQSLGLHFRVGFVELKIEGQQRPSQKEFEQWCQRVGPYYRIARSVDEVIAIWRDWRLVA